MKILFLAPLVLAAMPIMHASAACDGTWSRQKPARVEGRSNQRLEKVSASSPANTWAIGVSFMGRNGQPSAIAQRWNGRTWQLASVSKPDTRWFTDVLTLSRREAWVVGYRLKPSYQGVILRWNGSRLVPMNSADPGPGDSRLYGIDGTSPNDIWVVGSNGFDQNNEGGDPFIQHWDGTTWTETPAPAPGPFTTRLMAVSALTPDDAWAFGNHDGQTLVEHWDGSAWSIVPSPNPDNGDRGTWDIAAIAADDVWAVGNSWPGGFFTSDPMALHWNGTSIVETTSPEPDDATGLTGVDGLASDDVWAVGATFAPFGGTLVQHWDGTSWSLVAAPSPNASSLNGMDLVAPGTAWAVGSRIRAEDGDFRSLILNACGI